MNSISERAFAVFCNEVARDTGEKNDALREENASLEPFQHVLHSIQVRHGDIVLKEINMLEFIEENNDISPEDDEQFYTYLIDDIPSIPYASINELFISISGAHFNRHPLFICTNRLIGSPYKVLWEAEEASVQVELNSSHGVARVTGVLTMFDGTLETVQNLIDMGNDSLLIFQVEEVGDHNPLVGAVFTLKKIELFKRFLVDSVVAAEKTPDDATLNGIKDLNTLIEANEAHEELRMTIERHKTLLYRNAALKASQSLLHSVTVHYPGGSSPIHCNLLSGWKRIWIHDDDVATPFWFFYALEGENLSIPASSVALLDISLGGVPWTVPLKLLNTLQRRDRTPVFLGNGAFVDYGNGVGAFFTLNDSGTAAVVADQLGEDNVEPFIARAVARSLQGEELNDLEDQLEMHLVCFLVLFDDVKARLDLFGLDTTEHRSDGED